MNIKMLVVDGEKEISGEEGRENDKDFDRIFDDAVFIIVAAAGGMDPAFKGAKEGLVEYVRKPVSLEAVLGKIEKAVKKAEKIRKDLNELRELKKERKKWMEYDYLKNLKRCQNDLKESKARGGA
ncbi:MAG: hypothetical protein HQL30_09705 [Candidatus Omnitrophica bacterium]|nr:hypothetical protein [Candidatus Omnitrophota bacterium]